jgi:hypothetical protein
MRGIVSDDFLVLMQKLLSADNDMRKTAEEEYDKIENEPKVLFLLGAFENQTCPNEVRSLAAVLLRRFFSNNYDEFVEKLAERSFAQVKELLLRLVLAEQNDQLSRKICDAVAELARNIVSTHEVQQQDGATTEDGAAYPWPELLQFLFTCVSSEVPSQKLAALYVFVQFPGVLGDQQNRFLPEIKERLAQCIQDQTNQQSRFLAARAVVAFVLHNEGDKAVTKLFQDLLPPLLMVLNETTGEDDAVLKGLIEVAESMPLFLRPHLEAVCQLCLQISGNSELDESWRQLAFECITTLAESVPQMLRKHANKIMPEIARRGLQFMTEVEDDDDWGVQEENDDDLDSIAVAGETGLDRIACGVGGRAFLQFITPMLSELLGSSEWKSRHAALMAISVIGEGCHTQMESLLPRIVPSIVPFLEDAHPRVRYAACNAMGQMATDFNPTFQTKFHEGVMPKLLNVLEDNANPRVQAHGAAALVNFSEECPSSIMDIYLQQILAKLQILIQTKMNELGSPGMKAVLEQSVTTLAAVADASKSNFTAYYDAFMPNLKLIMLNAVQKELRMLRGKTIECISLIGLAVGKEKFMQDAADVMDMLLKAQVAQEEFDDDDPQVSYMMSAWARMCKILGDQFIQYLPIVMGPLMKVAQHKPEITFIDADDVEKEEEEGGWQFVNIGDNQNLGIRTSGLEDKATACQMLVCYARELKDGFAQYVDQVCELMLPLLKFYFHDGVRTAAAESLPFLLECSRSKGPEHVALLWRTVCDKLLEALKSEPENEIQSELIGSFAKCVELLGDGCLDDVMMQATLDTMEYLFEQHFKRQDERLEKRNDEDYDEGVEEMLQDENEGDVYLLSKIADMIHALFSTYRANFLPAFDKIVPFVVRLLPLDRPASDRQWGICIFDDVIEFCGPQSWVYSQVFLEPTLKYTVDPEPQVRQAASYGIGIMAIHGGSQYHDVCLSAVPLLKQAIGLAEARSSREHTVATENAISAMGKILRHCPVATQNLNMQQELVQWFSWLPVFEDEEEAVHVYDYLCQLIESNETAILGVDNMNVPKIMEVMADALAVDALSESPVVTKRCASIINQIKQNEAMWCASVSNLAEAQQHALLSCLNSLTAP